MTQYRIKYKKGCGYFIQNRDWTTYWMWQNIGYDNGEDFNICYYPTLKEADEKVRKLCWEKTQERTVYLYKS